MSERETYLKANQDRYLQQLLEFIALPSVSTDPAFQGAVRQAADFVLEQCRRAGLEPRLVETAGHPAVVATGPQRPGAPHLLIYGHYDVQPAEDVELWDRPPFEPRVEGGRIYGRGACDNKGQLWVHLCALECLNATGGIPLNVTVLVEGEEEIGSPHFGGLLRSLKDELQADLVLVSDTSTPVQGVPTVHYSLRGVVIGEVRLRTAARDLHSGIFGGTTPNAVAALVSLCSKLHDDHGRVTIPGFYDAVRPMADWERENLDRIPFDPEGYLSWIGASGLAGEEGFTTNERRWFRPTLEFNGIYGGYGGPGSKTIVPATAGVKLSARLVPDQEPRTIQRLVREWFQAHAPSFAELEVVDGFCGAPYLLERRDLMGAAERAVEKAFGVKPLFSRHGGAIAVVSEFREVLGLDTLLLGLGNPDDAVHSPNEKFELANFYGGVRASVSLLEELGSGGS